ncbi:hypothetical protein Q4577_14950 [Marinovum sp. 2_MG-2023]|uniref:hypothetical protein n=1 Tax=unclassified Marinovum TaxID=2647166 RepID=UPI0026E223D9|nr:MULTISPECIES: hypothetical protein [unclassified Marinovum]MDO6731328.1 hypothetical protein [Marinovum sp. 2_MG-2023]MDO6780773.1 hypothetical protein [Marinovum sp. 1_MG-2023]
MSNLEVGGKTLGKIHEAGNAKKFFCYFTGFLEGIVSSGGIEVGELEPLIRQCKEFVRNVSDCDANEILEDFDADLLEHEFLKDAVYYRALNIDANCEKSSVNRFLGFCAGIACDDLIKIEEAEALVKYAQQNSCILQDVYARSVVRTYIEALDDGIVDAQESADICREITRLVGDAYCDTGISSLGGTPVLDTLALGDDDGILQDAIMVLTGNFSISPRKLIEEELSARGAIIKKSVGKRTNFVVIASEASRDWVYTHKGTKIVKALQLRERENKPEFIAEHDLLRLLGIK